MCGGTELSAIRALNQAGLSPRVRGNLDRRLEVGGAGGSIPACAGEPRCEGTRPWAGRVYPRVCGGTRRLLLQPPFLAGLSPRVRGNPPASRALGDAGGSIPACAGEPSTICRRPASARVYPRVCGGTVSRNSPPPAGWGLSPRVRGNRGRSRSWRRPSGSIPACAGEPLLGAQPHCEQRVYPRVCGGTVPPGPLSGTKRGLSPRVRGNLGRGSAQAHRPGSIPACAGEPQRRVENEIARGVYPRVCGGTQWRLDVVDCAAGLSPRVRGNPFVADNPSQQLGSIPACAGEPCWWS